MKNLLLTPVFPIKKKEYTSFIYIATYEEMKNWDIPIAENAIASTQFLTLVTFAPTFHQDKQSLLVDKGSSLFLNMPSIYTENEEQYPIVIMDSSIPYMNVEILAFHLTRHKRFSLLIEDKDKLSKNSTKLMTSKSLFNIVKWVFNDLDPYEIPVVQKKLFSYIDSLLDAYPSLGYLPLKKRKNLREKSYMDSVIAWYMYLRYFKEFYYTKKHSYLPPIDKRVAIDNFEGNFFDRNNPIWKELDQKNNSPYSSEANNSFIYNKWLCHII
jgi:hypothetical protein